MNKADKIVDSITSDIHTGAILPKQKLPSIRKTAEDFKVSKNTVIDAYDKLTAQGLVHAVHGSGFYVSDLTDMDLQVTQPQHILEAFDRISLLNAQLNQEMHVRVGDGRPPLSWMQDALPEKLSGNFLRRFEGDQTAYGSANGNMSLREVIAKKYRINGMQTAAEQVVTTFGANHALDLIIRRFLEPGDTVLVDEPGYYPLFAKLKLSKINFIGVPRTPQGPDTHKLRLLAKQYRPKFFFTQSRYQNPTGSSMDLPTAHSVLQIGTMYGMRIVDNDPFFDLPDQTGVPLALLDQFENVIAISSYSKLLSASFRVGYLIASPQITKEIAELKLITTINSSRFTEMLTCEMITNRRYQRHLKKISAQLAELRANFNKHIEKIGLEVLDPNGGGFYSFLMLPANMDETQIARRALSKGIFLAPGKFFFVDEKSRVPAFRINITRADNMRFYQFLKNEVASSIS
ncbi:aminotransferase-like domain-containing protein [Kordiimonas pumila]|uniref:PLP-dependent aminotransferase family protein n=1 Tax=Kordiimonas pumila TaxID=2161677 RepID=A0ABV7D5Q6_9PROT|nr:PLP-dependent aminotransferase family protein [Kordiimonas pumila]